jgi:hypothetical protein
MARSQVACGANGLQIRKVVANILNKHSRAAGKGHFFTYTIGWEEGSNDNYIEKLTHYVMSYFGLGRILCELSWFMMESSGTLL